MLQLLCPNGDCHSEISFENNNRRIMMSNTGMLLWQYYSLKNTYSHNVEKMKSLAPRMNWKCNIEHHFDHNIISIIKKNHRKILPFNHWKHFLSYVVMSRYNPLTGGLWAPQLPELWLEIFLKSAPWCCAIVRKHLFSPFYFTEHRKTQNTAEHWTKN